MSIRKLIYTWTKDIRGTPAKSRKDVTLCYVHNSNIILESRIHKRPSRVARIVRVRNENHFSGVRRTRRPHSTCRGSFRFQVSAQDAKRSCTRTYITYRNGNAQRSVRSQVRQENALPSTLNRDLWFVRHSQDDRLHPYSPQSCAVVFSLIWIIIRITQRSAWPPKVFVNIFLFQLNVQIVNKPKPKYE